MIRDSKGQVARLLAKEGDKAVLRLESGETVAVEAGLLVAHEDGYVLPLAFDELAVDEAALDEAKPDKANEGAVMPVIEERAEVSKRQVQTGGVRLKKTVSEREEIIDEPLLNEDVSVERVSVNRMLDAPVDVRTEGDTTIIPVLEEVLVVEKRLMLKEELHVKKQRREVSEPQRLTLRSEQVEVEELAPEQQERD